MKVTFCIAAFFGAVVTPAARSGCGSIDSASAFGPEDTLLSCNGDFVLSRQGVNIVLQHKPSGRNFWQSPASDGAYFAFYNPDDQTTAGTPTSDITQPPQANLPKLDLTNSFGGSDAAQTASETDVPQASGEPQLPSSGTSLLSSDILNADASTLPFKTETTPELTQPVSATLPSLDEYIPSLTGQLPPLAGLEPVDNTQFGTDKPFSAQLFSSLGDSSEDTVTSDFNSASNTETAYIKARAILQNTQYSNSPFSGRLEVGDYGNLVIYRNGDNGIETRDWTSNTEGTSCPKDFLLNTEKERLVNHMKEGGYEDESSAFQDDVCAMFDPRWEELGIYEKDMPPSLAARAAQDDPNSPPKNNLNLHCKTVVLVHRLSVTFYSRDNHKFKAVLVVGNARLEKIFCYDYVAVTNAEGKVPDPAALYGEPVGWAGWFGFLWGGIAPGASFEGYSPPTDSSDLVIGGSVNGRSAHVSKRLARFEWKLPWINAFYNTDQYQGQLMYIKAFASGRVVCRGGKRCMKVPNP